MAEWLRSGLQIREHRFDSGPRLQLQKATLRVVFFVIKAMVLSEAIIYSVV